MMNRFKNLLFIALLSGVLSSCASIITGKMQAVEIASTPQGAQVFVDGEYRGKTPLVVLLGRSHKEAIHLKKPGYYEKVFTLNSDFNPAAVLNFFALPGILVDILGGAIFEYDQDRYLVRMVRQQSEK